MRAIFSICIGLVLQTFVTCATANAQAQTEDQTQYRTVPDIAYRQIDTDDAGAAYINERCKLDLYYPIDRQGFATVVWFHGGGLTSGEKFIPQQLRDQGIAVVAVNYRLYPKVKAPVYIEDAAAAAAWVFNHIKEYGGSDDRIFVSGHSAGGYLTSMIGLDKRWLAAHDIDADRIAGLIPFSGHTITHFTVRKERGIEGTQPVVDDLAPLNHVRQDAPPTLLITGDRELEMLGRYEETAYLWRMMKVVGHAQVELVELKGYNHGQMAGPAHPLLIEFIRNLENEPRLTPP